MGCLTDRGREVLEVGSACPSCVCAHSSLLAGAWGVGFRGPRVGAVFWDGPGAFNRFGCGFCSSPSRASAWIGVWGAGEA